MKHVLFVLSLLVGGTLVALAVIATAGCQSPASIASAGSAASAGLSANLDTAHTEISSARPHCDKTGQAHLVSADAAVSSGKSKLPAINAAIAMVASLQARVDRLTHQFFSPRQIGLAWVIGGSLTGLLILLCLLFFLTPLGPTIGPLAAGAFHTLTLGLTKLGSIVASKIKSNVAKAKSAIGGAVGSTGTSMASANAPHVATPKGMT